MNKYGLMFLVIACLFMAGLNLWNLFKDWFNEKYTRKDDTKEKDKRMERVQASPNIEPPSIVGKSKFNLKKEEQKQNQLEQEIKDLKTQLEEVKKNELLFSIPLEEVSPPPIDDRPISSEDEIILETEHDKTDTDLSGNQSFTMDEFEMVAKSLSGKAVSKEEKQHVAEIIPRIKGTDIYQRFIGQVNGAESIASEILMLAENDESDKESGIGSLSKFIRT